MVIESHVDIYFKKNSLPAPSHELQAVLTSRASAFESDLEISKKETTQLKAALNDAIKTISSLSRDIATLKTSKDTLALSTDAVAQVTIRAVADGGGDGDGGGGGVGFAFGVTHPGDGDRPGDGDDPTKTVSSVHVNVVRCRVYQMHANHILLLG